MASRRSEPLIRQHSADRAFSIRTTLPASLPSSANSSPKSRYYHSAAVDPDEESDGDLSDLSFHDPTNPKGWTHANGIFYTADEKTIPKQSFSLHSSYKNGITRSSISHTIPISKSESDFTEKSQRHNLPSLLIQSYQQPSINSREAGSTSNGERKLTAEEGKIHEDNKVNWDITTDSEKLNQFRSWMVCFCVVNFDLEIGQAIDYIYPAISLTSAEKRSVAFAAFPDSNVFSVGDSTFSFRIRASEEGGLACSGPTSEAGFLYGYVFFRQVKDESVRRGYFQKSLVLLSQNPYIGLFSRVVSILGPAFCDVGKPILEAAIHDIAHWPSPVPGRTHNLPLLGNVLQVELPLPGKAQLFETSSFDMRTLQHESQILASVSLTPLVVHCADILPDLWLLWELMLLAEPIVVFSPDPGVASDVVCGLVELICPIPYCGDYRPYFTIQDADFRGLVNKSQPPSNLVLGVTNPFFNTALEHWPNIVRVGRPRQKAQGTLTTGTRTPTKANHSAILRHVQGVKSKRTPLVAHDRDLLKLMAEARVQGSPSPQVVNNMLRRHFVDLTEKFLVPLNRYFSTLIPFNITTNPNLQPLPLKPFLPSDFFQSLNANGSPLPFRQTLKIRTTPTAELTRDFYAQFLKCGNFGTWLRGRMRDAEREVQKKWLAVLCDADMALWMRGKSEVEVVEMYLRVKEELTRAIALEPPKTPNPYTTTFPLLPPRQNPSSSSSLNISSDQQWTPASENRPTQKQVEQLRQQLKIIISGLPPDLRESILAKGPF